MALYGFPILLVLCAFLVQYQVGAELTCSSSNTSVIGVAFDSSKNQTGDWQHSVVVSKRGLERGLGYQKDDIQWNVEVGYLPVHCDEKRMDTLNVKISFSLRRLRNPEYKFYPGLGYYKYHSTLDTWPAAKATCEKEGAHLAIINSQQEADALKQLLVNVDHANLGLIKHDAKGEFVTLSGVPISKTGFSTWYSGVNPASAGANNVALLYKTGLLSYGDQSGKFGVICEQDL